MREIGAERHIKREGGGVRGKERNRERQRKSWIEREKGSKRSERERYRDGEIERECE